MQAVRNASQDFNASIHDSKPESFPLFLHAGSKETGYGTRDKPGLSKPVPIGLRLL